MSARCATGGVTSRMAGWRGCGGARGRDSRPRSGRMRQRSRRRSWTKPRAPMGAGRYRAYAPRLPGAVGRRSRRGGCRTNCAKGFAWRRPRHTLKGRQDAAAVAASRERLTDLKTQAAAGTIDLVFLDESEALTHPYLARCWARRGTELRIQAPGQAKKRAMLGAFDPVHRRLLVHTSPTKRSTDFVALLDQLGAAYGTAERTRPLVAVLDNGPIHTSKLTTKALAARPWLTLEWLPKYAPELNDIERCWRDLKQHQLANRTFADADALACAIPDAVARLNHERQPHSSPIPTRSA